MHQLIHGLPCQQVRNRTPHFKRAVSVLTRVSICYYNVLDKSNRRRFLWRFKSRLRLKFTNPGAAAVEAKQLSPL